MRAHIVTVAVVAAATAVGVVAVGSGTHPDEARAASDQNELTPFLRFTGVGTVHTKPDTATITVATNGEAATSKDALAASSRAMSQVLGKIRASKDPAISEDDIRSQGVSSFRQETGSRRWRATNTVQVTLRDPTKAGAVLASANAAGAVEVSGPHFSLEDRQKADGDALREAIKDARAAADAAAEEMGVKVTRVVSVSEPSQGPAYPYAAAGAYAVVADKALAPSVPAPIGTLGVQVQVVVTFAHSG